MTKEEKAIETLVWITEYLKETSDTPETIMNTISTRTETVLKGLKDE